MRLFSEILFLSNPFIVSVAIFRRPPATVSVYEIWWCILYHFGYKFNVEHYRTSFSDFASVFFLAAYNSQILALGGRRYCTSATLSSVDLSIGANIYVCVLDFWRGARETGRSEAFRRAFRWIRVSRNVPRPAFVTNFKHAYKFIYDFHLVHSFSFGFGLLQYIFRLFRCLFAVLLFSLLWPHYYFLRFANIPLFAPALVQIRMPDKYFLTQNFHAKHIRHAMRDIFSFYRKRIAPFHHKRPRSISLHMNRIKIFKSGVNMPNWCGTI